ncbi:hypothetical protein [Acrocarpospora phusangensis]|nr:hypothetical protein [Acrocarpospora phusangensis]
MTCLTPWCADHSPELDMCDAAPIPVPLFQRQMSGGIPGAVYLSVVAGGSPTVALYGSADEMSLEQADAVAYALLAMTARARAADQSHRNRGYGAPTCGEGAV